MWKKSANKEGLTDCYYGREKTRYKETWTGGSDVGLSPGRSG